VGDSTIMLAEKPSWIIVPSRVRVVHWLASSASRPYTRSHIKTLDNGLNFE
jgi:hypothetical protein